MICAAREGHSEVVSFLLDIEAHIEATNEVIFIAMELFVTMGIDDDDDDDAVERMDYCAEE